MSPQSLGMISFRVHPILNHNTLSTTPDPIIGFKSRIWSLPKLILGKLVLEVNSIAKRPILTLAVSCPRLEMNEARRYLSRRLWRVVNWVCSFLPSSRRGYNLLDLSLLTTLEVNGRFAFCVLVNAPWLSRLR